MAIALNPSLPAPNRSKQKLNLERDADGVLDIGWCEGVMSDGRPFRAEMWAQGSVSMLTFFFSSVGLEQLDDKAIGALLEREKMVAFKDGAPKYCTARALQDDSGAPSWSANVVVGDDDNTFVSDSVPIFHHRKQETPTSLFDWAQPNSGTK